MGVDGAFGRFTHPWITAQSEVVIRTKIKDFRPVGECNFNVLSTRDDAFRLEQTGGSDLLELRLEVGLHGTVHASKLGQNPRVQCTDLADATPKMTDSFSVR